MEELVVMASITKRFDDLVAVDAVDLGLQTGEIHALLGENGAGKSTLMKILSGTMAPNSGEIMVRGRRVTPRSPRDAAALGIGMVHQDYRLVSALTVAENLYLGWSEAPRMAGARVLSRRAAELQDRWGWQLDPDARVAELSIGEQQRVAILRALARGARVLILDEPTAVLSPPETTVLFERLRALAAEGVTIVFITHKLNEVMDISNSISVLRGGQMVGHMRTVDATPHHLVRMMIGRDVQSTVREPSSPPGPPVLVATSVTALGDRGETALCDLSLVVRRHEIVGVAGVTGNGQRELSEVLTGLRACRSGEIEVDGVRRTGSGAKKFLASGVRHIPEDRSTTGLVLGDSIARNAILREYRSAPLARGPWLQRRAIRSFVQALLTRYGIAKNPSAPVRHLSGGNRQKLLTGRELYGDPVLLVAVHPTQGIDVVATEEIHSSLRDARDAGTGVLLISEDLDEVLALSDRLVVMYEGRTVGEFDAGQVGVRESVGHLMSGRTPEKTVAQ